MKIYLLFFKLIDSTNIFHGVILWCSPDSQDPTSKCKYNNLVLTKFQWAQINHCHSSNFHFARFDANSIIWKIFDVEMSDQRKYKLNPINRKNRSFFQTACITNVGAIPFNISLFKVRLAFNFFSYKFIEFNIFRLLFSGKQSFWLLTVMPIAIIAF